MPGDVEMHEEEGRHSEQMLFGLQSRKASRSRPHGDLLAEGDVLEHEVRT
jgi:hypothetical protein